MHPRNRYCDRRPDFDALAKRHPALAARAVRDKDGKVVNLDWSHPGAAVELSRALLSDDFGIAWDFSADGQNLCPSVTRSLNYIHWVEDLINNQQNVRGIDIGTGASVIFPLLLVSLHPEWKIVASEVLEKSVQSARRIVSRNGWESKITIARVREETLFSGLVGTDDERYHFSMCNPPFFEHAETSEKSRGAASFQGLDREKVNLSGGEVGFVKRLIDDSCASCMREKVAWYTSMLGKKSSLRPLIRHAKARGIDNVRSTSFVQGKTLRWGIAWSFEHRDASQLDTTRPDCILAAKRAGKKRTLASEFCAQITLLEFEDRATDALSRFASSYDRVSGSEDGVVRFEGSLGSEARGPSFTASGASSGTRAVDVTICGSGAMYISSRSEFWTFAERFKQDILRTNRRWRRKRKRIDRIIISQVKNS